MTPAVMWCSNKCVHCWRAIELTLGSKLGKGIDSPSEIIDGCIKAQRKLLQGFKVDFKSKKKQMSRANMEKWEEAQEPTQFAISLSGEPTIYPLIGDLIAELRRRGKTSFLVTNGLYSEKIKELIKENNLPTQLYVSVMASNKKLYKKIVNSEFENSWERLNETLGLMGELTPRAYPEKSSLKIFTRGKCRTIFRMNLIKDLNMNDEHVEEYAELIKKAKPMFVEIKGFMSVGFARQRLGYDRMPTHEEMGKFVEKLSLATGLKILDSHERSRAWVLGEDGGKLKIKGI